jgi:predicted esterase
MSDEKAFQELRHRLIRLYEDGKHAPALEMLEQASSTFPDRQSHLVFWRMCLLSLSNRPQDVLSLFKQGLDSGLWWSAWQFKDHDLDAVRDLPEFIRLVQISGEKAKRESAELKPTRAVLIPEGSPPPWPLLVALHGRSGDKDANLESWQVARERGWLVLSPQSTQRAMSSGSYCWDDPVQGMKDIVLHMEEAGQIYGIKRQQSIIGGFSQGGGMALYAALHGGIHVRGFIGVGTYWEDAKELQASTADAPGLRAYFVVGGKDRTLERTREIQAILKENDIPTAEEAHPDLSHEFPADFGASMDRAVHFILESRE